VASVNSASRFSWQNKVPEGNVLAAPLLVVGSSLFSSIFAKCDGPTLRHSHRFLVLPFLDNLLAFFCPQVGFTCKFPASSVVLNRFPQEYRAGHLAESFLFFLFVFIMKGTGFPLLISHSVYQISSGSICIRSPPLDL
jgi:hypothetical protein